MERLGIGAVEGRTAKLCSSRCSETPFLSDTIAGRARCVGDGSDRLITGFASLPSPRAPAYLGHDPKPDGLVPLGGLGYTTAERSRVLSAVGASAMTIVSVPRHAHEALARDTRPPVHAHQFSSTIRADSGRYCGLRAQRRDPLEPKSALNTGTIRDDRAVAELGTDLEER